MEISLDILAKNHVHFLSNFVQKSLQMYNVLEHSKKVIKWTDKCISDKQI